MTSSNPPGQRFTASPWATDTLLGMIDTLWGELPVEIALRLADEQPELVEACKIIHELVSHE